MARTEYGTIDPNGNKTSGSGGWTVRKDGNGINLIVFEPSFDGAYAAVTTQIYPNDLQSNGGDTKDNSVIIGQDNNELKIKTGDGNGSASNRWVSFIAMG